MITHLHGIILDIDGFDITIDVNGVGYTATCTSSVFSRYSIGEKAKIFTKLIIREVGWSLYGFYSQSERKWFDILTDVQGVGGKVAITILSTIREDNLSTCIINEDKKTLCLVDGVGDRLAARIISELKPKMKKLIGSVLIKETIPSSFGNNIKNDVISALINLGYSRNDVVQLLGNVSISENDTFDSILKLALNRLAIS